MSSDHSQLDPDSTKECGQWCLPPWWRKVVRKVEEAGKDLAGLSRRGRDGLPW